MSLSDRYRRPTAYDDGVYQWHLGRVPKTLEVDGKQMANPARHHAIFVVHGMGMQRWAETAAELRFGFEEALEGIHDSMKSPPRKAEETPPPFIFEGFWADFDDLKKTFPEEWKRLDDDKRAFFSSVWRERAISAVRTFAWFARQQIRLLHPRVITEVSFIAWLLYFPLQVVSLALLTALLIRYRRILSQVLGDVRLYAAPEGIVERAIVQRIDRRVGSAFLRMLGLDWDFKPLAPKEKVQCDGEGVEFSRVIWVAHSLGSVVSYNVLSDLFRRSSELAAAGSPAQKRGVLKFRRTLRRFVTIGSPLDKIAHLFKENNVLRPFPDDRVLLLEGAEEMTLRGRKVYDWWINFYHVLDPVSGALDNKLIRGGQAPVNYHIGIWKLPGLAHVEYWRDKMTLRYILSRTYGKAFLPVDPAKPLSSFTLTLLAFFGYTVWSLLILLALYVFLLAVRFFVTGTWENILMDVLRGILAGAG